MLLEFSNLKGRLGEEMKTLIYLYISKWFKDDWTCRKTYSLIRKLAVLLWYTDCQWSLSLLLQSSVLSLFCRAVSFSTCWSFIDGAAHLQTKYFSLLSMIFIWQNNVTEVIPNFRTFILWISGDHIKKHSAFTVSHLLLFNIFMS